MIRYISLLRGINISGKNKIEMSSLKKLLAEYGYKNVTTYLNSGNVIFDSEIIDKKTIVKNVSNLIKDNFHLDIPVYVMTSDELIDLLASSPSWWGTTDKKIYDNLIFIMEPFKYQEIYEVLGEPNKELEQIKEYHNSIFWSFDLADYRKTNWWSRTAATSVNNKITIRTANTMKKLLELSNKLYD